MSSTSALTLVTDCLMAVDTFHLCRAGEIIGEFDVPALQRALDDGRLDGAEFVWREGLSEWQPILDFAQHPDPATPKQRALLTYLQIAVPPGNAAASELINQAINNPVLHPGLRTWRRDRLFLHPDLYAEELGAWRESRVDELYDAIDGGEFKVLFRQLTKKALREVVTYLDANYAGWDRLWDGPKWGLNAAMIVDSITPAITLLAPEKLAPQLRKNRVRPPDIGITDSVRSEDEYLGDLIEIGMMK